MPEFTFRDRRRAKVDSALTVLAADLTGLKTQLAADRAALSVAVDAAEIATLTAKLNPLNAAIALRETAQAALQFEQAALRGSGVLLEDATWRLVAADWLWTKPADILGLLNADPVFVALAQTSQFSIVTEQTLRTDRATWPASPAPPADLLDRVAALPGFTAAILEELIVTANRLLRDRRDGSSPFDHTATLLPLRIETLFPPEEPGRIWIRVTPDEPSIVRHRKIVTETEAESLREFWTVLSKRITAPPADPIQWLNDPAAGGEWEMFCKRIRPQRAAWLLAAFLPSMQNGRVVIDVDAKPDTDQTVRDQTDEVMAWPAALEVWYLNGADSAPRKLGDLVPVEPGNPDTPLAERPARLTLPLPGKDDDLSKHWLTDFVQAQRMGLGRKFTLPEGVTTETLAALFVVGLADESPEQLFRTQAMAGDLGLLRLGKPTNTVHGAAAADLARTAPDWFEIARRRLGADNTPRAGTQRMLLARLANALFRSGTPLLDCPLPAGSPDDPVDDAADTHTFVRALWPVLWGHFLRDHCKRTVGRDKFDAYDCWAWSLGNLRPEGPLPPLRIHDQPYAVLPVSTLAGWSAADVSDPRQQELEATIAARMGELRSVFAAAGPRTVVGADTAGVLDVLGRDALTRKYGYRLWARFDAFRGLFGAPVGNPDAAWKSAHTAPVDDRTGPNPFLTGGEQQFVDLPLIAAKRLPGEMQLDFRNNEDPRFTLARMIEWITFERYGPPRANAVLPWDTERLDIAHGLLRGIVPDSLLLRLMIESLMAAQAWSAEDQPGAAIDADLQTNRMHFDPNALPEKLKPLFDDVRDALHALAEHLDQWLKKAPPEPPVVDGPPLPIQRLDIPAERLAQLERSFRATLDAAVSRIDGWITGLAWRRLETARGSPRRRDGVGVYGWVDGPFRGIPGPNSAGLLHAPSQAQAITSVVLRDKFLSSNDRVARGQNIWEMSVTSATARTAANLGEECRLGIHLYEAVGHQVESILDNFPQIRAIRRIAPLRPDAPDPLVVCHGVAALDALLSPTPLPDPPGLPASELTPEAVRTALGPRKARLEHLRDSLDVYADLTIADAVHGLVTAQPHRAADAMDAASGFAAPPTLDVLRTPPSGYRLPTTMVSVLAAVPTGGMDRPPCRLAEPSLAGWIDARFPNPSAYRWKISRKASADLIAEAATPLLGLTLAEAATLPEQFLDHHG